MERLLSWVIRKRASVAVFCVSFFSTQILYSLIPPPPVSWIWATFNTFVLRQTCTNECYRVHTVQELGCLRYVETMT